jgi:hypothetical protein
VSILPEHGARESDRLLSVTGHAVSNLCSANSRGTPCWEDEEHPGEERLISIIRDRTGQTNTQVLKRFTWAN